MEPQSVARLTVEPSPRPEPASRATAGDGLIILGVLLVAVAVLLLAGGAWSLLWLGGACIVGGVAMERARP